MVPFPDVRCDPHLDRAGDLKAGKREEEREEGTRATDASSRTYHSPTQEGSVVTVILEENVSIVGGGPADCLES